MTIFITARLIKSPQNQLRRDKQLLLKNPHPADRIITTLLAVTMIPCITMTTRKHTPLIKQKPIMMKMVMFMSPTIITATITITHILPVLEGFTGIRMHHLHTTTHGTQTCTGTPITLTTTV